MKSAFFYCHIFYLFTAGRSSEYFTTHQCIHQHPLRGSMASKVISATTFFVPSTANHMESLPALARACPLNIIHKHQKKFYLTVTWGIEDQADHSVASFHEQSEVGKSLATCSKLSTGIILLNWRQNGDFEATCCLCQAIGPLLSCKSHIDRKPTEFSHLNFFLESRKAMEDEILGRLMRMIFNSIFLTATYPKETLFFSFSLAFVYTGSQVVTCDASLNSTHWNQHMYGSHIRYVCKVSISQNNSWWALLGMHEDFCFGKVQ